MSLCQRVGNANVWWFPKEFSQCRYGKYQKSGTNSCTLICLVLADKLAKEAHGLHANPCIFTSRAYEIFGQSIDTGNRVYYRNIKLKESEEVNLTIPDALKALRSDSNLQFGMSEWFYTQMKADDQQKNYFCTVALDLATIIRNTLTFFKQVNTTSRYLFAAIIADYRTVILTFDIPVQVAAIFDSHSHGRNTGALIAQASFQHIEELIYWFIDMLHRIYGSKPNLYEISFLTSKKFHGIEF